MDRNISPTDLQQAWQTAFQLRTCPTDAVLRAIIPDKNLERHLSSCSICREKRDMPAEQVGAWQNLFDKFAPQIHQAINDPQPGQIWIIRKELSRWGDDGYYYSPPNVMLLENLDRHRFLVVQLYSDKRLMGEGDIWLGDRFGFAQSWNTYAISRDSLECWLGIATDKQVAEVIQAGAVKPSPIEEHTALSFFRTLEKTAGSYAALLPVIEEVTEPSLNEAFLQRIFGSLAATYDKLAKFKLPEYADSLIDLLSGTTDPHSISPVTAATSMPLQVNIVMKQMDGTITIKTVGATLMENNWEDDDYYVAGKLKEIQEEDLTVVASLYVKDSVVCECQSTIEKGSPYFDIVFKAVPKESSSINNLKFILVKL